MTVRMTRQSIPCLVGNFRSKQSGHQLVISDPDTLKEDPRCILHLTSAAVPREWRLGTPARHVARPREGKVESREGYGGSSRPGAILSEDREGDSPTAAPLGLPSQGRNLQV